MTFPEKSACNGKVLNSHVAFVKNQKKTKTK